MITTVTCSIRRGHLTKNAGTHFCTLHSTVLHKYSLKRVKIYRIFFYEQFKKVFNFYFLKQRHVYRIVSKHLLCVCVYIYIYVLCYTNTVSKHLVVCMMFVFLRLSLYFCMIWFLIKRWWSFFVGRISDHRYIKFSMSMKETPMHTLWYW